METGTAVSMNLVEPALFLRRAVLGVGEVLDRAFVEAAMRHGPASRRPPEDHLLERVDEAAVFYAEADRDGRLFPKPRPPLVRERVIRKLPAGRVLELTWRSGWHPLHPDLEPYFAQARHNGTCHVRWHAHDAPAPAIILIHGWGMGQFAMEELAGRALWLYREGLDVLLATLPFHATRAEAHLAMPAFPSPDPFRTNETLAQAVLDLRELIALLRQRGTPEVGVSGMSLGGFTTALLATVEPGLAFAVPWIPLASIPELIWRIGQGTPSLDRARAAGLSKARFAAAFAPTTPLARTPRLSGRRMLIVAGRRDRVIPLDHARWLRDHFEGARLVTFAGSHLLQLGRAVAFVRLRDFLRSLSVLEPAGPFAALRHHA